MRKTLKDQIISTINSIKDEINKKDFELEELEEIRREVDRLSVAIYDKIVKIEMNEKKNTSAADVFVCKICGMEFTSKRSINSHLISHHHVKPNEDYIQRIKFPELQ